MTVKEQRKIFILKCFNIATELKNISCQASQDQANWHKFLNQYVMGLESLKALFNEKLAEN